MSAYYRQVDLGDIRIIQKKLHALCIEKHFIYSGVFWNEFDNALVPELNEAVEKALGTKIWLAAALVLTRDSSTLHTDHIVGQRGQKARLNIPILNCESSTTTFFKIPSHFFHLTSVNKDGTRVWQNREFFTPVDSVVLDKPTILRVSSPHTVFCGGVFPRISLTLNLEEDPVKYLED